MDEHTLNDLLECSVCLERLNTSSKVLPCQHTFCRKCLEVIYASRQELRCPECRVLVDTKIDDLPPNVLLMRILEGMKNAATKQGHSNADEMEKTTKTNRPLPISGVAVNDEGNRQEQQQTKHRQQSNNLQMQQHQHQLHYTQQTQLPPIAQLQSPSQLQQQHQLPPPNNQQHRRCIVPHAYALYDFDSSEGTDLKFKKGDLILLRRKIDNNWYVGQAKGVEGNFPINYVQVVVPLPSSQCVALYDFKMGPNEEEGCLTFKKGTVIQVLRRVDQNWAEGRIGTSIGIFPIAFVELNHMAKQLLETYSTSSSSNQPSPTHSVQQQQSNEFARTLPPVPIIDTPTAATSDSTSTSAAPIISNTQLSCSSSSNSSATTSPTSTTTHPSDCSSTTTSSSNTIFHSMPNSPQTSMPTTPQHSGHVTNASNSVRLRNHDPKQKRHSLNALLNSGTTALSIMQTNRHSAEILSVPNDFETELATTSATATGQTTVAREQQHHAMNFPTTVANQQPQSLQNASVSSSSTLQQSSSSTPRHNVLKTCVQQNIPPSLPWGYLALYPYKPRKNDELELKKGCVYMVIERCLDGWFKGKNWKDVSGVFPGNYVTPLRARDQQQLMHSWKLIPPTTYPTISTTHINNQAIIPNVSVQYQQSSSNYSTSMRNDLENINARLTLANLTPHQAMPPDLPPRQLTTSPTTTAQQNVLSKENRDKEALKEKPTTTGCMSTSSSAASSSSNATSSASTGLKKFFTHIKARSKSPGTAVAAAAVAASNLATTQINAAANNSATTTQQVKAQPSGKQTQRGNVNILTPVHVRSGSCPSQLLQNFPNEVTPPTQVVAEYKEVPTSAIQQAQSSPQAGYGSQRIKGPKERASVESSRPTIDSTLRSIYANHIQQQSSLMPKKCGQQYQQPTGLPLPANTNFTNSTTVIHRKSHSLDASNILQSSSIAPTTSSLSNSAGVSGINAAAIHASATTKSTSQNNMHESRFRCVVPYPPNSDVELELQVGDIIFVYRKQKNGWYKGTNSRTCKTGLFPASFVEPDL